MSTQSNQTFLKGSSISEVKNSKKPVQVITQGNETPPLVHGAQRLHYQYSAVLPTVHLTLISILQGIAFGVLLEGIPLPNLTQDLSWAFFTNQYFYLPYLISSLLIILIWKEFVQACIFVNWPISISQTALIYLIALFEILAFKTISFTYGITKSITPEMLSGWVIWIGVVGIFGGIIRVNNSFLEEAKDYETKELAKYFLKLERFEGLLYISLGIIFLILGCTYIFLSRNIPQVLTYLSWIIIASLLMAVLTVVLIDTYDRNKNIKVYIENSDLEFSKRGILRYKNIDRAIVLEQNETYDPSYKYMPSSQLWIPRK